MELKGVTIVHIGQTQDVSASFKKRELVIETDEQYPQQILTEFVQDKCGILDRYAEGEKVDVSINLRGRAWVNPQGETKWFNSIQGWHIKKTEGQQASAPPLPPKEKFEPETNFKEEEHDDLPF